MKYALMSDTKLELPTQDLGQYLGTVSFGIKVICEVDENYHIMNKAVVRFRDWERHTTRSSVSKRSVLRGFREKIS